MRPLIIVQSLLAMLLLLTCSCSGNGSISQTNSDPSTGAPGTGLPAPFDVTRSTSALSRFRLGSQHMPLLARNAVKTTGLALTLSPQQVDDFAWAVYELNAAGQQTPLALTLQWREQSADGAVWIGAGDLTSNSWEWTEPGAQTYPLDVARHMDINSRVLIAVVVTGAQPCTLELLRLGDLPPSPHDAITDGVTLVGGGNYGSRSTADSPLFEPLLWTSEVANGGDKYGLQGTLPVAGWAGYHGAGRVLFWSMHEAMWGSGKDDGGDNDRFRRQAIDWLLDGRARVGFATGHGEGIDTGGFSGAVKGWMDGQSISYADLGGTLHAGNLAAVDLLFMSYPNPLPAGEEDALARWVEEGGSLLLCAQGWSWNYGNGDHPLNRIGAHFGLKLYGGIIKDPDAPNAQPDTPNFAVMPLSEYTPARVVVLKKGVDNLADVTTLAAEQPQDIYVLEGEHFGLQVRNEDWVRLNDPVAAIDVLDQMYDTQVAYCGGHPPYGGEVVWAISVYDPAGAYWMHSGNPIVMKQEAGAEVVNSFNDYGVAGWGLAHELGHDMHSSACGNLFIPYGLAEPSANIFTVRTYEALGWDWAAGSHGDYADSGVTYHNQPNRDIEQLKGDAWILLGCLDLIWQAHGFEGMQAFLTETAEAHAAGTPAGDDDQRVAYLVEGISRGYERDFSPLFLHWGFPVSAQTQDYTEQWPDGDVVVP